MPRLRPGILRFLLWVALPAIGVFVAVCILVLASLELMTSEINRIDADRAEKAVNAAMSTLVEQMGEAARDESTWTEAYLNTYSPLNPGWVDSTWGTKARDDGAYDTVLVTDHQGRILFGESAPGPLSGNVTSVFSGSAAMARSLDAAITQIGDGARVAFFSKSRYGVAAVAAAVIHGTSGQVAIPPDQRRILWLAKHIDADMLVQVAHRFQIPLMRLDAPQHGEDRLKLLDAAGTLVGTLSWLPLQPGNSAYTHAAGVAVVVLMILGVMGTAVLLAFYRSVVRRAEVEERDWLNGRFDLATGLVNRFGLEEAIVRALPKRKREQPVALAIIEFEGLKDVVGSYGEQQGEALLEAVAQLVHRNIGAAATLARLGTDQFALSRTGAEAGTTVRAFATTMMSLVSEPIAVGPLRFKLGATIGVAEGQVGRNNVAEIFGMAGAALQRARETGGNHVVVYDASLEEERQRRLALQADIRRGLDADEFDLDYQPIFDLTRQDMLGVEALLRWRRRAGGPMSPAEFIPAAEASGLIEDLGLFALRRACREIAPWQGLKLSVNVSTVQFRSPALSTKIDGILEDTGFPAERLQLEITESFLLAQPERATAAIEELRARGIVIALDDFGTGFSSVGYLQQFRFDRVKLDRSLVDNVDRDPVKAALVESTMVFAFAMGLAVTAEGVERHEEARVLTRLGCREFQGYLFSKPLPLDGLERLLSQSEESLISKAS